MAKPNPLGKLLTDIGAPLLKRIVEETAPKPFDKIGSLAIDVIAEKIGADPTPESIVASYQSDPDVVTQQILALEQDPNVILAGVEQQRLTNELLLAEMDASKPKEPWWVWAWRPAGMWGLGVLWFWSIIGLHVLNAIFKIKLPQPDLQVLLALSGLYMTLYMGGHTLKDFVSKKWGAGS